MTETYPAHKIDDEVDVHIGADSQDMRGIVTGISYVCPLYMYVVQLNSPIEGEFGPQTGLYVPESLLVSKPDISGITERSPIGAYVFTIDEDDEVVDAIDVYVSVGSEDGILWYVLSDDVMDGVQPVVFTPFTSQADAESFAWDYTASNHEAAPGENAEQYLARISTEGNDG